MAETKDPNQIEDEYKQGLAYKRQMGFMTRWPMYERFRAGDQWPPETDKTKNLPRPVFNIIQQIEAHKVATVMNENIKMVFSPMEIPNQPPDPQGQQEAPEAEAADLFTRYADATWERIKQDQLNEEALEDSSNRGTAIWHYYWEQKLGTGDKRQTMGELCGEIIDPVNFFPGNPQQRSVQKQPYNIVTIRDDLESVKEEAKNNKVKDEQIAMIKPDKEVVDQGYDMARIEINNSQKVTVLIKYWKQDGSIWFNKVASGVQIKPATDTKMKLYPLVVMQWKRRKRSIFGVGDTEGLIPNQKAINFLMAMQLLSVQLTGWPKMRINPMHVKQQITNIPGEVIVDTSESGTGVSYMNPANMPGHIPMLVQNFLQYTKETAGSNENALGEKTTAQLNASAIMLLQKAAGIPIESIKRRFYQAMEDIGLVWEQFWKTYINIDRNITVQDDNGTPMTVPFNGSAHKDTELNLKIDIGPSSSYSETLMMSSLDKLFDNKYISLDQYLKYAPKNVIPFKDRLLKDIEKQQQMQQQQANDPMALISQLTPHEQQQFLSAAPQVQQQILAQLMHQMPPQAPAQAPMQASPAPIQPQPGGMPNG